MNIDRLEHPKPTVEAPRCSQCGAVAQALMAKTANNYGRWFFKCPDNHKNKFFWADEYNPTNQAGQQHYAQQHSQQAPGMPGTAAAASHPHFGTPAGPSLSGARHTPTSPAYPMSQPLPQQQTPPMPYSGTQYSGTQYGGTQRDDTQYGGTQRDDTQYGGTQRGGTQYGGTQRGGTQYGGMQYGDTQYGDTQYGGAGQYAPMPTPLSPQTPQQLAADVGGTVSSQWSPASQQPPPLYQFWSQPKPHSQPQTPYQSQQQQPWQQQVPPQPISQYVQQQPPPPTQQQQALHNVGSGTLVSVQVLGLGGTGAIGLSIPVFNDAFRTAMMDLPRASTQRCWDRTLKCWRIKSDSYSQVQAMLMERGFLLQDAPPRVIAILVTRRSPYSPRYSMEDAKEIASQRVDPGLWSRLFRYQKEGVVAGMRFEGRALLADEMGLGKTVQALTLMSCYPEDWPLLVVCPTSMRYTWAETIQEWLPPHLRPAPRDLWLITSAADWNRLAREAGIPAYEDATAATAAGGSSIITGSSLGSGGGASGYSRGTVRPHVAVVSYDLAAKMSGEHATRYHSIICDESHMLKSRATARYERLGPMVKAARRAVFTTGTPLLNRPMEIWPQVDLLRPGLLGSFTEFGERYCLSNQALAARHQHQRGGGGSSQPLSPASSAHHPYPGSDYRGTANVGELHLLLAEAVMVRRLKRDVLGDLPPKIRTKVTVQPNDLDLRPVTAALQDLRRVEMAVQRGEMGPREADMARRQAWSAAYRATGPAKEAEATAFIDRLLHIQDIEVESEMGGNATQWSGGSGGACDVTRMSEAEDRGEGGKMLVFAHHQEVLDRLEEHMKKRHVRYIRIDGSVNPERREAAVREFQSLGPRSPRVALLALHAAGAGLTLTAASVVVFLELDQTPALLAQAEDRAHRVGQGSHVHVYYLMGRGTLDERIWKMLEKKKFLMGAALDGDLEAQKHQQQEGEEEEEEEIIKTARVDGAERNAEGRTNGDANGQLHSRRRLVSSAGQHNPASARAAGPLQLGCPGAYGTGSGRGLGVAVGSAPSPDQPRQEGSWGGEEGGGGGGGSPMLIRTSHPRSEPQRRRTRSRTVMEDEEEAPPPAPALRRPAAGPAATVVATAAIQNPQAVLRGGLPNAAMPSTQGSRGHPDLNVDLTQMGSGGFEEENEGSPEDGGGGARGCILT